LEKKMKKLMPFLGLLFLSLLVLPLQGQYQFQVNPFTGKPLPGPYNPLTGTGGKQDSGPNPLTGKTAPPSGVHNPFTGTFKSGMQPPGPLMSQTPSDFPITGKAGPKLDELDEVVKLIMDRHGIPGGALAIAKDGRLVYAKGFGWADLAAAIKVDPQTMFSLASLSKPITALAILLLIEQGKLSLDDNPFDIIRIPAPPRARVDPRLRQVTVRQMLNHTGGWDRNVKGDPINWSPQISRALGVPMPISEQQFISFMRAIPLDFDPGTKMQYSNVGYIVLGQVVEKVSGQSYEQFIEENIFKPAGIRHAFLNRGGQTQYRKGEARSYMPGSGAMLPPMSLPMVKAAGGWRVSAVDMVRLLTALDGSRGKPLLKEQTFQQMLALPPPPLKPKANGVYNGLGWPSVKVSGKTFAYAHEGQFPGARTFMKRNANGVNWALLFNVSMDLDQVDVSAISQVVRDIHERVEALKEYPDIDYFKDYP
jgi:N-acyl-D-amino-acid deacylase